VMTHAEYDQEKWKADCGCFEPPPKKTTAKKKTIPKKKSVRGA